MDNNHHTHSDSAYGQAEAHALYKACQSVIENRDCRCEPDLPKCSVCHCCEAIALVHQKMSDDPQPVSETAPITRDQFMAFFRSDTFHEQMSDDDCRELFALSLKGASDFTAEFLNDILEDYSVEDVLVINLKTLDWR